MTNQQDAALLPVEQEVESGDCQIDDTFTGLCNRVKESGMRFAAETTRLRDVLQTLAVNAKRTTAPLDLVAWMADHLDDIIAGKSLYDATWNTRAEQAKPSGESAGAVERVLEQLALLRKHDGDGCYFRHDNTQIRFDLHGRAALAARWLYDHSEEAVAAIAALSERGAVGEEVERATEAYRELAEKLAEHVCIYGDEDGPDYCGECHGCLCGRASTAIAQLLALSERGAVGEVERLREALEPFATFADNFIDAEGWTGPMKQERIVDWFGPSDFRRARAALASGAGDDLGASGGKG